MSSDSSPFADLDAYLALRRLGTIALSLDGSRLVATAQDLDAKGTGYVSALWEVDVHGVEPARRLTRSAKGESAPAFARDGGLWFTSGRPAPPTGGDEDEERPALWRLPAGGGEAARVATRAGGVGPLIVARGSGTVVVGAGVLPGSTDDADDAARRKARKDKKVTAILHDASPVRYWDHDLGPDQPHLFVSSATTAATADERAEIPLTDITPQPGRSLDEASFAVSDDGVFVVTEWTEPEGTADARTDLVLIDVATGARHTLATDPDHTFGSPAISPDGLTVACIRQRRSSADEPVDSRLWLVPIDGSPGHDPVPDLDLWPDAPCWSPDGRTVYFTADELGHGPAFAVDVATGTVTKLTTDGVVAHLQPSPDGQYLYATRSSYTDSGSIIRIDLTDPAGAEPLVLSGPAAVLELPGTLTEVTSTAADGTPLRAWLAVPAGAGATAKAPLLLWVHGGPLGSWNAWSWRWNPWLMVARGYAVLLPDPALSTGYGLAMIRRGWGDWGGAPYTDLMTMTDAVLERDDVDPGRVAAMGGSFGGYMANWIAGHTDRFSAIVTHASLWSLGQFGGTTDLPAYWRREMTPERAAANSPHAFAADIRTPMLVVHGDRDYRVPIGEGLSLWASLLEHHDGDPASLPHRFLYFPDENHWVLTPQHAKLWYETVHAFLAWHVLGEPWSAPELL
jgi:dipeptidyl aminopeptidase/acylaminoacyl peptidase